MAGWRNQDLISLTSLFFLIFSENVILEGEDRDGFFRSFVALSAHYIGLNVTQCKCSGCSIHFSSSFQI